MVSVQYRKRYLKRVYKHKVSGKQLIYVDESGFDHHNYREYGWAPVGEKIYDYRSGKRIKRTSLIAAHIDKKIEAPMLFDGTCNAKVFNYWLEHFLTQHLNDNTVVIMDNATFHKSIKTKEIVEKTGAELLFLPPYSPELNPIENDFAVMKKNQKYNSHITLDRIIDM